MGISRIRGHVGIKKNKIKHKDIKKMKEYNEYEGMIWDGKSPVYSEDLDRFFMDRDELEEYVYDELFFEDTYEFKTNPNVLYEKLKLVHCEHNLPFGNFDLCGLHREYFHDDFDCPSDLPEGMKAAERSINESIDELIEDYKNIYGYSPVRVKVIDKKRLTSDIKNK